METLEEQLQNLKRGIESVNQRKRELDAENNEAEKQLKIHKASIAELQEKQDQLSNKVLPAASGDEILELDVGGKYFKAYRSTLTLFKDSVLSTLVSSRWADSARQKDGRIFIDWDPDAFSEILSFLRMYRLGDTSEYRLSRRAASLSDYLGIPVGGVEGSERVALQSSFSGTGAGDHAHIVSGGFVFNIAWSGLQPCTLKAFKLLSHNAVKAKLYLRIGGHGPLDTQFEVGLDERWQLNQEFELKNGETMVMLRSARSQCLLMPNSTIGIYISLDKGPDDINYLRYSPSVPSIAHSNLGSNGQCSLNARSLTCMAGWHVHPSFKRGAEAHRFFIGSVLYEVDP